MNEDAKSTTKNTLTDEVQKSRVSHFESSRKVSGWYGGSLPKPTHIEGAHYSVFTLFYDLFREYEKLISSHSPEFSKLTAELTIAHTTGGYPIAFESHHFFDGKYEFSGFAGTHYMSQFGFPKNFRFPNLMEIIQQEDEKRKLVNSETNSENLSIDNRMLALQEIFDLRDHTEYLTKKLWGRGQVNTVLTDFKIPEDVRVQLKEAAKEHNLINRLVGAYL